MRLPSNDVYARKGPTAKAHAGSSGSPDDLKHAHRRKAVPSNAPLPRTLKWAESLPSSVRLAALLRQYARIGNALAASWDDPKAFSSYLGSLLEDDRGDRKGFPPDVLNELLALREYHAAHITDEPPTWGVYRKRG